MVLRSGLSGVAFHEERMVLLLCQRQVVRGSEVRGCVGVPVGRGRPEELQLGDVSSVYLNIYLYLDTDLENLTCNPESAFSKALKHCHAKGS